NLSAVVVDTQPYHFPTVPAVQKKGFHPLGASLGEPVEKLDPGDFRVISATYSSGRLWATLTSQMLDTNGVPRAVVDYFAFSPNNFPSAAFDPVNNTSVGPIQIARAGNEPEDGFTGYRAFGGNGVARWGDYSAAAIDTDGVIWMATEYTPDIARTSFANWCTYITRLQP